jgi:hypothetical protein
MPKSSKWSLSFRHIHQTLVRISLFLHTCHMPRPSYPLVCLLEQYLVTKDIEQYLREYVKSTGVVQGHGCDFSCVEVSGSSPG